MLSQRRDGWNVEGYRYRVLNSGLVSRIIRIETMAHLADLMLLIPSVFLDSLPPKYKPSVGFPVADGLLRRN